uniref:Uncharacterized protein n=1 Tax=Anguilla anguilla TaxID=7936 RepID=A0A0E9RUB3_ANGAN
MFQTRTEFKVVWGQQRCCNEKQRYPTHWLNDISV